MAKQATTSRAQEALTVEQLDALIDAIETRSPTGKRNAALVTLLGDTGLRIGEALALTTRDLVTEAGQIMAVKVRRGKGGKPANIAVGRRAAAALARWLEARAALGIDAGPMFCTVSRGKHVGGRATAEGFGAGAEATELTPGTPVSAEYVRQLLARLAERAGIDQRVTPHTLRHTFATHLLRETGNLKLVQQALRHSDVSTTARVYSHLTDRDVEDAVRALRDGAAPDPEPEALAVRIAAMTPDQRAALAALLGEVK